MTPNRRTERSREHYEDDRENEEGLLAAIKLRVTFWITFSIGALIVFVAYAVVYGTLVDFGIIGSKGWMGNFGMLLGLVAVAWLYGQWIQAKFDYWPGS